MKHLAILICVSAWTYALAAAEPAYKFIREIPIGGEGGWDILTIDSAGRRLYLSHSTTIEVVDIDSNKVVGTIDDTPGVHAFLSIPALKHGFSSNGKENKSSVVDLQTLKTTAKLETGDSPDAITYDSRRTEVYVFNHRGNSATVIDAKAAKVVATIQLIGSPEFGVFDPLTDKIYCNIEDKSEVTTIDGVKHEAIAHWPLAPGAEPSGIALDSAHHRLFAACNNKMLVMLDTKTGKVLSTLPIGDHVDGCAFDDATQLVFISCGDGTTTIGKEDGPDRLALVQRLQTEPGARTMALDSKTHRIFLPTARFQPAPSPSPGTSPARPTIVSNTLKLLVYELTGSAAN